jgi:hypothetical protein
MDTFTNPIIVSNARGQTINPSYHNRFGEVSSHIVTIDSRDRDRGLYANANDFRLNFAQEYKNVTSIELLDIVLPIPAAITEKQAILIIDGIPINEQTVPSETTATSTVNGVYSGSFAVIPLVPLYGTNPDVTHWEAHDNRIKKTFMPPIGSLRGARFRLQLRGNTATPTGYTFANESPPGAMAADDNYYMKLEIISQN